MIFRSRPQEVWSTSGDSFGGWYHCEKRLDLEQCQRNQYF